MNAGEKTAIAEFLNLAAGYVKDGYKREIENYSFNDDPQEPEQTSLPLAYITEESEEDETGEDSLNAIAAEISACAACGLSATRTFVVPGEGAERPLVMVIGEGPGAEEDKTGRPFVGKAGQLLDKMLASIGLSRDENCFIANMVKCRPPGNRDPAYEEITACGQFLKRQISLLRPRFILCAGRVAAQSLLKTGTGINALRGDFLELQLGETAIPVLCTYHPSAILRNESLKRPAWEDLKLLKSRVEERD